MARSEDSKTTNNEHKRELAKLRLDSRVLEDVDDLEKPIFKDKEETIEEIYSSSNTLMDFRMPYRYTPRSEDLEK